MMEYYKSILEGMARTFSKLVLYCKKPYMFATNHAIDKETLCKKYRYSKPEYAIIPLNDSGWEIVGLPHIMKDPTDSNILLYNQWILYEIEDL